MNLYPWKYGNTSEEIASQVESQWETPGGAQEKADKAEENAKEYADETFAKNAFSKVASPGRSTVNADDKEDTLTIEAGTGIAITTDPIQKKVTIWTQGDSAPGAHGETHNNDGSDPIPDLQEVTQDLATHKADDVIHRPIKFLESTPTEQDLSNGEIGFVPFPEHPTFAFKNLFINGAMEIWQRGIGSYSGTQIYTADRWVSGNQSQNVIERREDAPEGFRYSLYFQRNSSISAFQQDQRIESVNCIPLVGETVTISFWAKRGLNDPNAIRVRLFHADSPDDFSSFTQFHQSNTQPLTDEWQRYSFTVESLPEEVKNGIRVFIQVQTGDTFPQAVQITGCQFELGDKATPFEHRDIGTELALCQRYFQLRSTDDVDPLDLRPTMRTTPTITGSESPYSYDAEL